MYYCNMYSRVLTKYLCHCILGSFENFVLFCGFNNFMHYLFQILNNLLCINYNEQANRVFYINHYEKNLFYFSLLRRKTFPTSFCSYLFGHLV